MVETLIIELFFCQGPRSDGALGEANVAKLNLALARRYHSVGLRAEEEECGASQPPPEPFPTGSMRYPAFRTQVHRALARLAADAAGREKVMAQLIAELGKNSDEDGTSGGPAAAVEQVARSADAEAMACEAPAVEEMEASKEVPCWAPRDHVQQVQDIYKNLFAEVTAHEKSQETINAVRALSASALQSSKQVLEIARQYKATTLEASRVVGDRLLGAKADPMALLRSLAPVACDEGEAGVAAAPLAQTPVAPMAFDEDEDELAASPLAAEATPTFGGASLPRRTNEASEAPSLWRFDAGDGLHMDIRTTADVGAARTGHYVLPGQDFRVAQEVVGDDGIRYLELADGRGWLFESKPGVGTMCVRSKQKQLLTL
mmetsp:Transcript_45182/g.127903  ORF Transcript_45182/g.127903 Transcript_45182/m.127903 type:complete len:375 (+) Transcript_45182:79-1203(+)